MTKLKRSPTQAPARQLEKHELAKLVRANAEALFQTLAGQATFNRAYNPACPPKRRTKKETRPAE